MRHDGRATTEKREDQAKRSTDHTKKHHVSHWEPRRTARCFDGAADMFAVGSSVKRNASKCSSRSVVRRVGGEVALLNVLLATIRRFLAKGKHRGAHARCR